ncbi:cupin domain-containing protein [Oscillibacter sp. 1-3]|uniref:cupin domain-containing protein n=1 Tax=Oscillibacter sp. 1-3 TaxID=1235797 RepID=UPI00033BCE3A|nr:cupin domain-containing protein [Oscillibacter sp. 1-3]EOS67255.1 hypothetical protein C816_00287 [Oscillibacter sp. 1-3]MCI9510991.1 cupin domain-containing protein [Oscillibacter sp.]
MDGFTPVLCHTGFLAKRVFGEAGRVLDVSIAHLEPQGGGPAPAHSHPGRDHLFIVTQGVMEARTPEGVRRFGPNEALLVPGGQIHEVWNAGDGPAVVVGVTLAAE